MSEYLAAPASATDNIDNEAHVTHNPSYRALVLRAAVGAAPPQCCRSAGIKIFEQRVICRAEELRRRFAGYPRRPLGSHRSVLSVERGVGIALCNCEASGDQLMLSQSCQCTA
ncbi:Hypothetical protein, putative [Bodo saltans]|uniref:Uncharacterized protein n=1 Tax=Bodo saltans TaxID=75058 RepID=A0A0S4JB61_BODSA|nr:Hypothetical protein, putative [Bodo saltans]|eukprot:CUG87438.1 Hypothetical protein, putative [Bodo saltans]